MTDKRIAFKFAPDIHKWLEDNYRANGHATLANSPNPSLAEYVKSKTAPPEPEQEGPLTPDQEVDKITEEMGSLNEQYDEKFEAIRSLSPKDAPKIETPDDLEKLIALIWVKLRANNGFVRRSRNKAGGDIETGLANVRTAWETTSQEA